MPEGPEIRRAADTLARFLVGRPLVRIEYRVPRLTRKARALRGATITRIFARGKALLIEFDRGLTHYSHNQLYGEWVIARSAQEHDDTRQVRVFIATTTHAATLYSATEIELLDAAALARQPYLRKLGPDVLDPTTTVPIVRARIADPRYARSSLASLLLDQGFVAGLGNYLRSDILFAARLIPSARPADLRAAEVNRLAMVMLKLARQSYRTGGVTNEPALARASKRAGVAYDDYRFLVYGREGKPCRVCATCIRRASATGRGLFYCPACQHE